MLDCTGLSIKVVLSIHTIDSMFSYTRKRGVVKWEYINLNGTETFVMRALQTFQNFYARKMIGQI